MSAVPFPAKSDAVTTLSVHYLIHATDIYRVPAPCTRMSPWTTQAKISVLLKFSTHAVIFLVFSCIVTSSSSTFKDTCDYIGLTKTIQGTLFKCGCLVKANSTCRLNSPLPCSNIVTDSGAKEEEIFGRPSFCLP